MKTPDLAELIAQHDGLLAEMMALGGPPELYYDCWLDSFPDQYDDAPEPVRVLDANGIPTGDYNYELIDKGHWPTADQSRGWLTHRIGCMERFLPVLRAEAEREAEEKARIEADRLEAQRKQFEQFAKAKSEKAAELAAYIAKWGPARNAAWGVIENFADYTPAGLLKCFEEDVVEDYQVRWRIGTCVQTYLGTLLFLMKASSVVRKSKYADAIIERIVALHGSVLDPERKLPSTVKQFDDEKYIPPGYGWDRGYDGDRDLRPERMHEFDEAVLEPFFDVDELPTLLDPPRDLIERMRESAPVRAADDIADADEVDWDVRGLIQRGTVVLVTAKPKVGKSFLTSDLTLALASDNPEWMGLKTVPGKHVLYLNAEGAMSQRLAAYKKRHGKLPKKFFTMPLKVKLDTIGMAALVQQIKGHEDDHGRVDVLVIDPLARAIPGSEVSDRDMAAFIDSAESLTGGGTRTVIVVHHLGKDESAGPRGHSSLSGAVTAEIRLTLDPKTGVRHISVPFCREAEEWAGGRFRLAPVPLGKDRFGETIHSAVVERVGGAAQDSLPKMGKNQKAVYAVLQALSAEIGEQDDAGLVRVPLAVLIDRAGSELGIEPKRRVERIKAALTALEGAVGFDGEAAWALV